MSDYLDPPIDRLETEEPHAQCSESPCEDCARERSHQDDLAAANPQCVASCAAMPECAVCHMTKHPRGRDPGLYASAGYCAYECAGNSQEPQAGHLWPNEWADIEESRARKAGRR